MTHDPLCLCDQCVAHDSLCTTVLNSEMSEAFCDCDVIRRVRADERTKRDVNGFWPPAFQDGYAAALRDAVAAVEALDDGKTVPPNDGYAEAVAAITALGDADLAKHAAELDFASLHEEERS